MWSWIKDLEYNNNNYVNM